MNDKKDEQLHAPNAKEPTPSVSPTTVNPDSTISFTGDFAAQLAALVAGGLDKEELDSIASLPSGCGLLIVRKGDGLGSRYFLDADTQIAGRHPNADIFLDDVTVSRRHAEITRKDKVFYMRDMGSLNGTYYNGERIDVCVLKNGGQAQIGKYRLTFYASPFDIDPTQVINPQSTK